MNSKSTISILTCFSLIACSNPQPGPDKTLGGAVLGAGWGATTGAIVGNQLSNTTGGALAGAGLGAVAGALTGVGYDVVEGSQLEQERMLASLKVQNTLNARYLEQLQAKLDRAVVSDPAAIYQVYFEPDETSLKSGAAADLEAIAEAIKTSPTNATISVIGHSDDSGTPDYNQRLAEARARNVAAYLAARGISVDRINVRSFGSTRPISSNATPEGRQMNRRVEVYLDPAPK
ncbi:MAG: OmpA family protein [Oligoflexia bacterium]|nr:OmpA family protein [Oligoflexia bacterium]